MAASTSTPAPHRLVTIPISHYCERARWALDIAGAAYTEDKWPPLIHILPLRWASRGRGSSVPLLITNTGLRLHDSGDIVKWVARTYPDTAGHLYPPNLQEEIDKWERVFTGRLGVLVRVVVYHYLFSKDMKTIVPTMTQTIPPSRARWFRAFASVITSLIKKGYRVNAQSAETCTNKIRVLFADVSTALSDGRPFIVSGSLAPTAADITFAALVAPILCADKYGGRLGLQIPDLETPGWPCSELSVTRAGRHALKMYDMYRLPREQQKQ